jgi:O-antigen ligase
MRGARTTPEQALAAETLTARPSTRGLRWVDRLAFGLLMALLAWAPLPLGSARPWAVGPLAAALCGLLLLWLLAVAWAGGVQSLAAKGESFRWPVWPLTLLSLYGLLVWLQFQVLPVALLQLMQVPDVDGPGLLSADPSATAQYFAGCLVCTAGFALTVFLVRSPKRMRWLLGTIVAAGVCQAILAIVLFGRQKAYTIFFLTQDVYGRATGTFPNFDHLAGYMELCLSAGFGLMLASLGSGKEERTDWQRRLVQALTFLMSKKMVLRLLLVVMVIALVLTRSRMGNGAFFASLLLTAVLCALRSHKLRRTALWLAVSLLVVDLVVIGQWVGLDRVIERLEKTPVLTQQAAPGEPAQNVRHEESLEQRLQAARYALAMVRERPWFGFGGSTFFTEFPRFKGDKPLGFYNHVHNDYVEIAVETGLVGLALLAALVLAALWRAVARLSDSSSQLVRGVSAGTCMALSCLLLHSLVDFNLQIPANALTFTMLLATGWCLNGTPVAMRTRRSVGRVGQQGPEASPRPRGASKG